jgi:hypothetical protein
VVRVGDMETPAEADPVRVAYVPGGNAHEVRGAVILACFNNTRCFIAPELPDEQKQALAQASMAPMRYRKRCSPAGRPGAQPQPSRAAAQGAAAPSARRHARQARKD